MPTGTIYDPRHSNDFDKAKMIFNAQGVSANPSLNGTTNVDLYFSDDHVLTGFYLLGSGATLGDKFDLKVIDTDNIFGFGAGASIKQFATDIFIPVTFDVQFDVPYPAKIYAGLSLRVVYHSTALLGITPFFAANFKVHKVLV